MKLHDNFVSYKLRKHTNMNPLMPMDWHTLIKLSTLFQFSFSAHASIFPQILFALNGKLLLFFFFN